MGVPSGSRTNKKSASTTSKASKSKSTNTRTDLKLTKKDVEIVKKRLKSLLEKEKLASKPKSNNVKSSRSSENSRVSPCTGSGCYFKKKDDNVSRPRSSTKATTSKSKTKTTAKKSTTTTKKVATKKPSNKSNSSSTRACNSATGCPYVKPKPAKKSNTTAKKSSSTRRTTSSCSGGSCFFQVDTTKSTKKTNPIIKKQPSNWKVEKSTNCAAKRKAPEPKVIPKKITKPAIVPKVVPKKISKPAIVPKVKPKTTKNVANTTKKAGAVKKKVNGKSCAPCTWSESDDDEEEDFSSFDDDSYSDYTDDSETDDDYGRGGYGPSGRNQRPDKSFSEYDSWETESEESFVCKGGTCSSVKKRGSSPERIEASTDTSLVPVQNSNAQGPAHEDNLYLNDYSFNMETDSDDEEYSCEQDYLDISSFEEEEDSLGSVEESFADYFSADDEDYELPEDVNEDVYIKRGEAKVYELSDTDVGFDSDASSAQVIELSQDNNAEDSEIDGAWPIVHDQKMSETSQSSCSDSEREVYETPKLSTIPYIVEANSLNNTNSDIEISTAKINDYIRPSYEDSEEQTLVNTDPLSKIMNPHSYVNAANCEIITTNEVVGFDYDLEQLSEEEASESDSVPCFDEFNSKFYNALNSRHVLVLLKDPLYIYGTLKLTLVAGRFEIFGYYPEKNEEVTVYSPRGYSCLSIKPTKNRISDTITQQELDKFKGDFLITDLTELIQLFDGQNDAIILMERNDRDKKVEMLRKHMKENLFPNMNSITLGRPFYASEFILRCILFKFNPNCIKIDPRWDNIKMTTSSKVIIIGGKGVGKSTLLRYLINKNIRELKKFLLIDLDIGQPEIFVPQTISAKIIDKPILGPGYLYGMLPEKSLVYGDINVVLSPISYLRNVKELVKFCYEDDRFEDIPWIVNTMGYNKGFGSELISVISQLIDPTDIIQIQSSKDINNFDCLMTSEVLMSIPRNIFCDEIDWKYYLPKHQLTKIYSPVRGKRTKEWDMSPKDMRYANIISRLGTILSGTNEWLTDVKPVCAPIDELNIFCFSDVDLEKEDLLDVINGNLVYLCRQSTDCIECFGIGIVRGVDRIIEKIYLIHSVPTSMLRNVNKLAVCNVPLPSSIMLNQGPKIKGVTPYTYNTSNFVATRHVNPIYCRPQQSHQVILD